MSVWRQRAYEIIVEVDRTLSADAPLKARIRALNAQAWYAHQGTSWGKKVWAQAKTAYLVQHGLKPRRYRVAPASLPLFEERV